MQKGKNTVLKDVRIKLQIPLNCAKYTNALVRNPQKRVDFS